jgi:phospholipid/cholesterol/gamma-HCH transport system substrate-binding protein
MADEAVRTTRARARFDREVWVGLFAAAAFVTVILLGLTLKGRVLLGGGLVVHTHVTDAATLREGSPVQLRGVRVGRVQRLRLTGQDVKITMRLEEGVPVPADSRARVDPPALVGQASISLIPGQSTALLRPGTVLPGAAQTGVLQNAQALGDEAGQVLHRANRLLGEENLNNIARTTAEMRELTRSLQQSARGLERGLAGPEVARIVGQTRGLLDSLERMTTTLNRSVEGAAALVASTEKGQGTLGKLATDPSLYQNLNRAATEAGRAAAEIQRLAEDVRRNPKRYVDLSLF